MRFGRTGAYARLVVMSKRSLLLLVTLAAACSLSPRKPLTLAELPDLSGNAMLADIRKLSSDEFEERIPGSQGETLTVAYLTERLKEAGLEPGNPDGTWTQKVPMVGLTPEVRGPLVIKKGAQKREFKVNDDFVAFSKHVADEAKIENSELVFAGYGVQAPEFQWDDFSDMDVRGKAIIVLVNDPPVPDDKIFGGKAMTYYGR